MVFLIWNRFTCIVPVIDLRRTIDEYRMLVKGDEILEFSSFPTCLVIWIVIFTAMGGISGLLSNGKCREGKLAPWVWVLHFFLV